MKKHNEKKIIGIILIAVLMVALFSVRNTGLLNNLDPKSIKNSVNSFGAWAPVVYIIMFSLVPLTLFPDSILAIAGGMAFGIVQGSIFTIIGALIGGTISFYISRLLGREIVDKIVRGKGKWFEDGIEKKGFLLILTLRLIPLVPFDIISYGAGLSKIKYRDFAFATFIGIIPGVLIFSNLGDKTVNVKSPEFIIAVALLIGLLVLSYFLKKKVTFEKLQDEIKVSGTKRFRN